MENESHDGCAPDDKSTQERSGEQYPEEYAYNANYYHHESMPPPHFMYPVLEGFQPPINIAMNMIPIPIPVPIQTDIAAASSNNINANAYDNGNNVNYTNGGNVPWIGVNHGAVMPSIDANRRAQFL